MVIDTMEKPKIIPLGKKYKEVQFVFTNPTPSDVLLNLFDTDALPLNTDQFIPPVTVTTTFALPSATYGIAINPYTNMAYITNNINNNVYVVNTATNTLVTTIAVAGAGVFTAIQYNSITNQMYVCDDGNGEVYVINCATNTVSGSAINVGGIGADVKNICFDSTNNRMYVSASNISDVKVINCVTNLVIASVTIGTFPTGLDFNSVNGYVYVCDDPSNTVYIINTTTNTVVGTISIGGGTSPIAICYNATNNTMYVANIGTDDVRIIDCTTNTLTGSPISVGTFPNDITFNGNNNLIYVSNNDSSNVSVIDCTTDTVTNTITTAADPKGIAVRNATNTLYVTSESTSTMSVIGNGTQVYVGSYPNYNQFVNDLNNNPKSIRQIKLLGSSVIQIGQAFNILNSDANGQRYSTPRYPVYDISADQFQSNITVVNFSEGELILSNGAAYISNYVLKANSYVTFVIYYKEIRRIDLIYNGHKSVLEKLVNNISPDANIVTEEEIELITPDKPYIRPLWQQPFSTTKIASEMIEKQLLDIKKAETTK